MLYEGLFSIENKEPWFKYLIWRRDFNDLHLENLLQNPT